jgi:hypothetical protein
LFDSLGDVINHFLLVNSWFVGLSLDFGSGSLDQRPRSKYKDLFSSNLLRALLHFTLSHAQSQRAFNLAQPLH